MGLKLIPLISSPCADWVPCFSEDLKVPLLFWHQDFWADALQESHTGLPSLRFADFQPPSLSISVFGRFGRRQEFSFQPCRQSSAPSPFPLPEFRSR